MSDVPEQCVRMGTTTHIIERYCRLAPGHDGDHEIEPEPIPHDLQEAVDTLLRFHIGDMVYYIRERVDFSELEDGQSSWEHPDVVAWSKACSTLERYSPVRHSTKLAE